MGTHCPQTLTIDFAAFLVDPHKPEWDEFRHHYIQCEPCTAELAQWAHVENMLRSMEKNAVDTHPTVEQLAQFQQRQELLSQEEYHEIQDHLTGCLACSEELACFDSFDFSRLGEAIPETDKQAVFDRTRESQSFAVRLRNELKMFEIKHIFDSLRSVLVHPVFTYAVILLLCVPTLRYYSLSATLGLTRSPKVPLTTRSVPRLPTPAVVPSATRVPSADKPGAAAQAVLRQYKTAYEAQDVQSLRNIWAMSSEEQEDITQLFHETRNLALLVELKEAKPSEKGDGIVVAFEQVTTLLGDTDSFSARGPFSYMAEIRKDKDSGVWMLHEVQEQSN